MKTLVLGLTFLGFTILMQSQNDIASVDVNLNEYVKPARKAAINANYYRAFNEQISSERARKFQNLVANYDVKASTIYTSDARSNYDVVFTEGENQIEAQYNQDGEIIQCKEQFKDIKLPYAISRDIAKNYPGWKFNEVNCEVSYTLNDDQEVIYKVAIENGSKMKTLKLNAADYNP